MGFGNATYNYLFWEAKSTNSIDISQVKTGFFVKNDEVISFLEEKLTEAGLTSQEQADFITFWAPRLNQNKLNFIHFMFNQTCNRLAELNISPTPDNIYRIYILWSKVDEEFEIDEQKIIRANREGFTVIEWGGQHHTMIQKKYKFIGINMCLI